MRHFAKEKKVLFVFVTLLALFLIIPIYVFSIYFYNIDWISRNAYLKDFPLEELLEVKKVLQIEDDYKVELKDGTVYAYFQNSEIFESDNKWVVYEIQYDDFDNDGEKELLTLHWSQDDYGRELDIAKERRGNKWSNHLFLYSFEEHEVKLKWGSSTLNDPVISLEIVEEAGSVDSAGSLQAGSPQDGLNYLKVQEGRYKDFDNNGQLKVVDESLWKWEGWWFGRVDE